MQGADYQAAQQGLIEQARRVAMQSVADRFRKDNILIYDIGKLYNRADDGTVTFRNPDDPNHPFASRHEAQQWIDSMNSQIRSAYQEEVRKEERKVVEELQPSMQMLRFAPVYDAMPDNVREIFDELIDPYTVTDGQGNPIGFNCNLTAMARQALNLSKRFGSGQPTAQAQQASQQAAEPAMDIQTGTGSATDDEPKTIEEAMRILNERKRGKR